MYSVPVGVFLLVQFLCLILLRMSCGRSLSVLRILPTGMCFFPAWLLLFAFRDLWKEWGDSNFQIFFSTELPVPPQAAGVVGTFNVLDIYPSEHYGLSFLDLTDAIFYKVFLPAVRIEPSTCSLEVTKSDALTNCAMGAICSCLVEYVGECLVCVMYVCRWL